ncbi:hypothetical protein EYS14_19540 [Alteromonadaceae bacterium M269]|nr:hypothetical protein EYS14_19540 [Alteromonadaceae bacterium M269]
MSNVHINKKTIFILLGILVIAISLFFLYSLSSKPSEVPVADVGIKARPAITEYKTLATDWDWQKARSHIEQTQHTITNFDHLPFTAQSVFDALQAVKVDKDSHLILDHDALISLDEALERIHNKLDADSLLALKNLIRESLPGIAGEQTAAIVEQYYHYLQAKDEFSRVNEGLSGDNSNQNLESLSDDQALYAELQALREVHLGTENTAKLFRVSDANATYMFESMKLGLDNSLSAEQKEQKRREIQENHTEQAVNILNWPSRYRAFLADKQSILSASLDNDEKRNQVAQLLSQHFSPSEIERIQYLNLSSI